MDKTNEINSVEDILKKINKEKSDRLTKAAKGLETTINKIKKLEEELSKL